MSTYLKNKLLRRQSGGMDLPGRQHRSRSLDVEALQRSGVQALMIKAAAQHQQQLAVQYHVTLSSGGAWLWVRIFFGAFPNLVPSASGGTSFYLAFLSRQNDFDTGCESRWISLANIRTYNV
uniref:Uncharacterized protein n=1 Tax=Anopheles farauti TaxID=69004 RepID=A0A182QE05_9DIPT